MGNPLANRKQEVASSEDETDHSKNQPQQPRSELRLPFGAASPEAQETGVDLNSQPSCDHLIPSASKQRAKPPTARRPPSRKEQDEPDQEISRKGKDDARLRLVKEVAEEKKRQEEYEQKLKEDKQKLK